MPFITEELWQKTAGERGRDTMLVNAAWPVYEGLGDADAAAEMEWVIR
jgi:valyl-tRNA synthetase